MIANGAAREWSTPGKFKNSVDPLPEQHKTLRVLHANARIGKVDRSLLDSGVFEHGTIPGPEHAWIRDERRVRLDPSKAIAPIGHSP